MTAEDDEAREFEEKLRSGLRTTKKYGVSGTRNSISTRNAGGGDHGGKSEKDSLWAYGQDERRVLVTPSMLRNKKKEAKMQMSYLRDDEIMVLRYDHNKQRRQQNPHPIEHAGGIGERSMRNVKELIHIINPNSTIQSRKHKTGYAGGGGGGDDSENHPGRGSKGPPIQNSRRGSGSTGPRALGVSDLELFGVRFAPEDSTSLAKAGTNVTKMTKEQREKKAKEIFAQGANLKTAAMAELETYDPQLIHFSVYLHNTFGTCAKALRALDDNGNNSVGYTEMELNLVRKRDDFPSDYVTLRFIFDTLCKDRGSDIITYAQTKPLTRIHELLEQIQREIDRGEADNAQNQALDGVTNMLRGRISRGKQSVAMDRALGPDMSRGVSEGGSQALQRPSQQQQQHPNPPTIMVTGSV